MTEEAELAKERHALFFEKMQAEGHGAVDIGMITAHGAAKRDNPAYLYCARALGTQMGNPTVGRCACCARSHSWSAIRRRLFLPSCMDGAPG